MVWVEVSHDRPVRSANHNRIPFEYFRNTPLDTNLYLKSPQDDSLFLPSLRKLTSSDTILFKNQSSRTFILNSLSVPK